MSTNTKEAAIEACIERYLTGGESVMPVRRPRPFSASSKARSNFSDFNQAGPLPVA